MNAARIPIINNYVFAFEWIYVRCKYLWTVSLYLISFGRHYNNNLEIKTNFDSNAQLAQLTYSWFDELIVHSLFLIMYNI
jgi:hypothetical protein